MQEIPLIRLFDDQGRRLYLNDQERYVFAEATLSEKISNEVRTFCRTLYFTGCRPAEALALTNDQIDFDGETIVIRSLKKNTTVPHYRGIPVPSSFLDELNLVYSLKKRRKESFRLWPWSSVKGWYSVKKVMELAGIEGGHATPKGLRHSFGVAHALLKTPLPQIQKWLGHKHIQTTAVYMQVVCEEERKLASGLWKTKNDESVAY